MKLKALENYSASRIAVGQVRGADGKPFAVEPGKVGYLTPAAYSHPLVQRFIGAGLRDYEESAPPPADEPKPAPAPVAPPVEEKEDNIRERYLTAPGITESNVDAVLEAFPTLDDLADASKDELIEAGVSKSFTSRLLDWVVEE